VDFEEKPHRQLCSAYLKGEAPPPLLSQSLLWRKRRGANRPIYITLKLMSTPKMSIFALAKVRMGAWFLSILD